MRKLLKNASLCFFCGDIFSTGFYLLYGGEFTHFIMKATGTLIIGIIGGLAGLAGKDLYPLLKQVIKSKLFKNK